MRCVTCNDAVERGSRGNRGFHSQARGSSVRAALKRWDKGERLKGCGNGMEVGEGKSGKNWLG